MWVSIDGTPVYQFNRPPKEQRRALSQGRRRRLRALAIVACLLFFGGFLTLIASLIVNFSGHLEVALWLLGVGLPSALIGALLSALYDYEDGRDKRMRARIVRGAHRAWFAAPVDFSFRAVPPGLRDVLDGSPLDAYFGETRELDEQLKAPLPEAPEEQPKAARARRDAKDRIIEIAQLLPGADDEAHFVAELKRGVATEFDRAIQAVRDYQQTVLAAIHEVVPAGR